MVYPELTPELTGTNGTKRNYGRGTAPRCPSRRDVELLAGAEEGREWDGKGFKEMGGTYLHEFNK